MMEIIGVHILIVIPVITSNESKGSVSFVQSHGGPFRSYLIGTVPLRLHIIARGPHAIGRKEHYGLQFNCYGKLNTFPTFNPDSLSHHTDFRWPMTSE